MQVIKLHKGSLASATVDSPPGHRNAQGQDHASWVVKLGGKEAESLKESLKCCAEGYSGPCAGVQLCSEISIEECLVIVGHQTTQKAAW